MLAKVAPETANRQDAARALVKVNVEQRETATNEKPDLVTVTGSNFT